MTAPKWAVEVFDAATDAATGASVKYKPSAREAAALELSRRCVPIEEYQRVVGVANKLDGYTLHKTQCALYQSSYATNYPECSCGLTDVREDILTRTALKETGNAD